jgi:hypothetical protein
MPRSSSEISSDSPTRAGDGANFSPPPGEIPQVPPAAFRNARENGGM